MPTRHVRRHIRQYIRRSLRTTLPPGRVILVLWVCVMGGGCRESENGPGGFDVMEKSVSELTRALESGDVTSQELVRLYLQRIDVDTSVGGTASTPRGPFLRRIGQRRARATGGFAMTGRELRLLRAGALYVDVHTANEVAGALRVDLRLPTDPPESAP